MASIIHTTAEASVVVIQPGDGGPCLTFHVGRAVITLPPAASARFSVAGDVLPGLPDLPLGKRLALAVLAGDDEAYPLADEVQDRRLAALDGRPFVSRDELLALLRRLEWVMQWHEVFHSCPICHVGYGGAHAADCKLAWAIGAEREDS